MGRLIFELVGVHFRLEFLSYVVMPPFENLKDNLYRITIKGARSRILPRHSEHLNNLLCTLGGMTSAIVGYHQVSCSVVSVVLEECSL